MLSKNARERLQEILLRLEKGENVSLEERKYLHKTADRDQSMACWLHQARRKQQNREPCDAIEKLLDELTISSLDSDNSYSGKQEELAEFFIGAPSWLGRS